MKIARKIMLVALAVIALTLVMSISIFAEDATGTVYEVATKNELDTAFNKLVDGDTIKLTADIDVGNTQYTFSKAVTFDLNGQKLTTTYGWTNILLKNSGCVITSSKVDEKGDIVRGTIFHKGGTAIIKVWHADKIENVDLISSRDDKSKTSGGIAIQKDGTAYVGSIKNVSVSGDTLTYGIETQAREGNVIGTLEDVTLTANTNGIELKGASVGSATNCTISGKLSGIAITDKEVSISLVGCVVSGGTQAVNISATNVSITANNTTDFESESGTIFNAGTSSVTYDVIGYTQNEDGTLTACAHENVVAGSCTVKTVCSDCTKVLDYVHSFVELNRVDSTCTEKGYVTYACSLCGTEEVEALKLADHTYNGVVTAPGCETEGYTTYTCTVCGDSYEGDKVAATGHSYNGVVTDPTCETAGYTTYTCSCGDTYTEEGAAALGHKYVETSRVEATQEENGYIEYTCSVCQDTMREELLYCAHDFVVIEEVKVSCLNDGYAKYECSLCGETKEETIKKEAHTYDWNIVGCPKCGTLAVLDENSTNVSSNLGYKIYFATTLNDLSNTNYDVIRLKNNISLPSGGKITNANAIIDLGGNVLYRNGGYLGLRIVSAKGFVNGYVYKTDGGSQIMAVTSLEFMEDVTLAANSTKSNNATGLMMNTAGAYLGSMKNVTICAGVLKDFNSNNFDFVNVGTNGIYNHGIEATQGTIGSMENVKISTYGQAITSAAKIGTMTNCVFSADNIALNITTLQSEMEFVNCEIHSKNLAIYIANAVESTAEAPVAFKLGNTKIVTDGAVYDISSHISSRPIFNALTTAVALVNGQLYTSLEAAVNALNASTEEVTTFALIGDLAVGSTIVIDKKVNFSFGGASYDVPVYGTNQVAHKTVLGYTVTSSVDVVFSVVEGGYLTISGDGKLIGGDEAIVADGGEVLIAAGTYVGFNPQDFVSTSSCVVNNDGTYTIASEHDYDDEVGADKVTYQVDGVCNNCGYVRGNFAVDNVYYATLEEALAAALVNGKQVVLAADIVIDGDVVWDLTGATFNFNGLTLTVNGTLSIVGGTFTQDVSEYVSEEYCHYKNNKNLYVVTAHTWTDATCTAPKTCTACGATEGEALGHTWTDATCTDPKTCSVCGETEGEALGHTWTDATCTDPKKCSVCGATEGEALGHSYFYPCDKVCMVCHEITNPDATHNIVHVEAKAGTDCQTWDGNIEYWYCSDCGVVWADEALTEVTNIKSVNTNGEHSYFYPCDVVCQVCHEETNPDATHNIVHVEAKAGTDCQTWDGNIEYWYCSYCGAAWADEANTQMINLMSVKVNGDHNYVAGEPAEDGSVTYTCDGCGDSYIESVEHTHTEVEIPAVLPTPSNAGHTAGIKCSECGEILVPTTEIPALGIDAGFNFSAANINLSESIALKFFVNIPTNYENTYIVFKFMGEEITTDVHSADIKNGVNRHIYTFAGILPIYMGETIEATVCANVNGEIVSKTLEYSVKNYCVSVINSASSSSKFKTVVTDLLVYGAAAQVYVEPTISDEELVTNGVNLSNATQEFTKLTAEENNKLSMAGEAYDGLSWTAVNLYAKDTISMKFYFTVGSNVDVSKLQIKLEYLDEAKYIDVTSLNYDNEKERYEVTFTNIWPIYYDEIVNASFVLDGVEVGKSLNYSVNTYILSNQDKVSAFGDFIRALSNYSKAVCAYAK